MIYPPRHAEKSIRRHFVEASCHDQDGIPSSCIVGGSSRSHDAWLRRFSPSIELNPRRASWATVLSGTRECGFSTSLWGDRHPGSPECILGAPQNELCMCRSNPHMQGSIRNQSSLVLHVCVCVCVCVCVYICLFACLCVSVSVGDCVSCVSVFLWTGFLSDDQGKLAN